MAAKNSPPDTPGVAGPVPAGVSLDRITRRADFLAAQRCVRNVAGALTLEVAPSPPGARPDRIRVGFTASRKIGNAVCRNRAKRRMRAAAAAALPLSGRPGHDYVLVARATVLTRDFQALLGDLAAALAAAHRKLDAKAGGGS